MARGVESVVECGNVLGEGAYWDGATATLWWVDVPMPSKLWSFHPASGRVETYSMPEMITSVNARRNLNGLVIASHGGINFWDFETQNLRLVARPEPDKPFNRCNDGASDRNGRFWFGTMQNNIAPDGSEIALIGNSGSLYRFDADMSLHRHEADVGIPNTVCWSPDGATMYFSDTTTSWISAYDFSATEGAVSNKRRFARFDRGVPDGSTIDSEGYLWNARWGGGCVARFAPDGSVDRVIELPCSLVTSCTFGGQALDTLYITTARYLQNEVALRETPLAGNLFAIEPGVRGLPSGRFAG